MIRTVETSKELEEINRIHEDVFGFKIEEKRLASLHHMFPRTFFTAYEQEQMRGYCYLKIVLGLKGPKPILKARLLSIAALPKHREKRIGAILFQRAIHILKDLGVTELYFEPDRLPIIETMTGLTIDSMERVQKRVKPGRIELHIQN